jgi:gamma-glutamyltranspeptidase / glutathione hydrolase
MDLATPRSYRPTVYGNSHMVVSGHHLATMAGIRMLEAGGNAVDAGVAAGFALNVVHCDMASLGGVAPIMIRMAQTGEVTTFAGVGRWPNAASREALSKAGGGQIPASHLRWVVPAAVDSWLAALQAYGTMTVADVLAPAIELADRGFPCHYFMLYNLSVSLGKVSQWPYTASLFLRDGRLPEVGDPIRQPDLADTLRSLADAERRIGGSRAAGIQAARDHFYRGEIAQRIGAFAQELGAFLTEEDLRRYAVQELPAVKTTYRGRSVFACGPWSQGPAVLQMLNLAEATDLAHADPVDCLHTMIESAKLALLDRNAYYGDPDFVPVPVDRLLSKEHAGELRSRINPERALIDVPGRRGPISPDTTYVCVVDREGNAFSATPSDSSMLVTPIVPGLGFGISDRGLQASLDPDDPNAVLPGKRPRLTPNPGMVVADDMVLPYGTPGGDIQTQAMFQFLVSLLDFGMELQQAAEAPRWGSYAVPVTESPHACSPGLVRMESRFAPAVVSALAARGHTVELWPDLSAQAGGICAIWHNPRTGLVAGAADPRRMAYAFGW